MPDRPKRRKNNKNKRKNKNHRPDSNKSSDVNTPVAVETSDQVVVASTSSCVNHNEQEEKLKNTFGVSRDLPLAEQNVSITDEKLVQDQNNNEDSQLLSISPPIKDFEENANDVQISEKYVVESPENTVKGKSKLKNNIKSKSLDNDDDPKIVEISDEVDAGQSEGENAIAIIESSNVLVTDVESDVEWEKLDEIQDDKIPSLQELAKGTLSVTTLPLSVAQCEETKTLTPEAERSLRNYLKTLNLSTHPTDPGCVEIKTEIEHIINREIRQRLRKKGLTDDFLCQRSTLPRVLDVIDEEGSGESSVASRRLSHISDKKSDAEDLDDDVFIDEKKIKEKYSTKAVNSMSGPRHVIQKCVLVGAKIKEPEISEARCDWTMKTVEKLSGAEVVYLTDSSSSTSSIHDFGDETDDGVETDVSVRMITPTIEVTDTESLLKKTFTSNEVDEHQKVEELQNKHENKIRNTQTPDTDTAFASDNANENAPYQHYAPSNHEIIVTSTDNIKTNLYVKDIETVDDNAKKGDTKTKPLIENSEQSKANGEYDLEIKVLKCELNDAFNNLIKEVSSDSETTTENPKDSFTRQDSSSSVCSSQCTAKYNPSYSSLNDVSNMHEETCDSIKMHKESTNICDTSRHVKDVFECVTGTSTQNRSQGGNKQPSDLRDLCVKKIATFPYGEKILEELASVSKRLQNITVFGTVASKNKEFKQTEGNEEKMPYYPLPEVSTIETVSLEMNRKSSVPPPIQPRNSSLKKSQDDHWTGLPTKTEPVYVCLSPSQKMLMEKTNTIITKEDASHLVDMHTKFVDRRGYNENKKKERAQSDNTPVVPFKSQTGSRLLALIRDPNVTSNINSSMTKRFNQSLDQIDKSYSRVQSMSKRIQEHFDSIKDFSPSFKPIPPPRPKKYSSTFYESDESSDFTDSSFRSMKNERKFFHYSTGNLNKEIENEVSTIQNMHRYYTNMRDEISSQNCPRRPSLPKDICEQQMEYIRQKEKEVEAEIRRLEEQKLNTSRIVDRKGPRAPLICETESVEGKLTDNNNYHKVQKQDVFCTKPAEKQEKSKLSSVFSSSQEEILRDKMYSEYVNQMAAREERKQHKVIKITNYPTTKDIKSVSKSTSALDSLDSKVNNRIEKEFICKARERWEKLGIKDPETEDERESKDVYQEPKVIEHKIKVIEGDEEKDVQKLPSHLQEFVRFTAKDKDESGEPAIWRPGAPTPPPAPAAPATERSPGAPPPPPPPPIWTPSSAGPSPQPQRKTFRPVHFEETPPARRKFGSSDQNGCTSGSESEGRLRTSLSAPASGLNSLSASNSTSRLPRAQNPTVTLLQKAREGQIPRGSNYLNHQDARLPRDRPSPPRGDPVHALRKEYASEGEADRSDYERGGGPRKMADAHRKVEGIGPTTKEGMPVALRSEVKDPSKWYKKMYDTIHKNKYDDDYVTIRYKNRRGEPPKRVSNKSQYAYFDPRSGYLSEPEGGLSRLGSSTWSDAYDSDVNTGPRRRTASVQEDRKAEITSPYLPSNKYSTLASARASQEVYKNQPGRIENYVPGKSSVVDKEAKQWWDEVMDIFDGQNVSSTTSLPQASPKERKDITAAILSKSNMARALKESGYESDSMLVFRRRDDTEAPLSPAERRAAYRDLQAGGEPPLRGFRSPAPPRLDESEIEYIPISSTLTKIRVHKKTPQVHEVICYPATGVDTSQGFKKTHPSFISVDVHRSDSDYPPAPPRRISSKNSRTLRLVTNTRPVSTSPKRSAPQSQSNVDFLRNKISSKLTRQNTHIITKRGSVPDTKIVKQKSPNSRVMSISAPPAINRKNLTPANKTVAKLPADSKISCTSSFGSPRRTLLPTEYNSIHTKYGESHPSVVIEGGAGRRTPISNILDKVTSLDKLWSSEKRNVRIDVAKVKSKSLARTTSASTSKITKTTTSNSKASSPTSTHKSRDMTRTAEKIQKLKVSNNHAKSNLCLASKGDTKTKSCALSTTQNISKSALNISSPTKKPSQIKTATVTNLKKKKSLDSVTIRPRSLPCHEACSKKSKENNKTVKKSPKSKTMKKVTSKSSNESESGSQFGDSSNGTSNFGSIENFYKRPISAKEIQKTRDAVVSDSFFQHLFFGNSRLPVVSYSMVEPNTTVMQKARMFQSYPQETITPKSLNSYLIHRKPVSLSRFKMWDRYPSPSRSQSPRSVSWPGRTHKEIRKFDSLVKCEDYGSTSSLVTVRSKSEPPINKIYFSQTSRPRSPTVVFYKNQQESPPKKEISPSRIFFSQTSRPVSPVITRKTQKSVPGDRNKSQSPTRIVFSETVRPISPSVKRRNIPKLDVIEIYSQEEKLPTTMFFSQTSRPVSPKVIKKSPSRSRSKSTSPVSIRSPSYRRISCAKQSKQQKEYGLKCILRTRSADDTSKTLTKDNLTKKKSESNLEAQDPDYEEYIQDMKNSKARSERFRELNRYYAYLERVGELEKTTSNCDLRHRRKDEEIIDFDRWKKIRAIERAEEELNNLYYKLKIAQNEKDFLFYPRDVKDYRWNYDRDRGLRIKEKSVEDLKDHFQQIPYYDSMEVDQPQSKDKYKPLWRGTSVAETAFNINRKNYTDRYDFHEPKTPLVMLHQDTSLGELRKKIGLGNRLWSSLSMDQVNALKHQLNAIYSKEIESKTNKDNENYIVDVKDDDKSPTKPTLHVRCNSLITPPYSPVPEKELSKSESIAAISCPITSVKELKNNVNKIQMSLSENEKRKISQTISKEVLDRIHKFDNAAPLTLKQEIENSQVKESTHLETKDIVGQSPKESCIETGSTEKHSDTVKDHYLENVVTSSEKLETQNQSSASETETASSDVSAKTVIYREPKKEVQKKVEYFESVKNMSSLTSTIYHARENSDEKVKPVKGSTSTDNKETDHQKNSIFQSQSCANFKELFGESERNKFLSLHAKPEVHSRSPSPHSEVNVTERYTPDTPRYSSDETIWRSRSPSPDPERYWRAYLNLARAGEVRRLARRFDSPSAAGAVLRRHRSDPELARIKWSSDHNIYRRNKTRCALPVARVPLRSTNRYMPHIDIISKLASLRRRTIPRSRSAEEPSECRSGEVDRIRRRFEAMSLLGQIYASAPDVSELREIAPYLAGRWIAHTYPKRSDNNRSITDPNIFIHGSTSPVRKEVKRAVSKESVKLSSILKSDTFAKQEFDPSLHRPASRYEPPRAPPRPPPASWPYRLAPYVTPSRPTVTFQETDSAPEPPRRTPYGSLSDTESPRRYVESDVNIHYRCPVRHDPLPLVPERELARQQAEHMKRLYREQKRNKYLQENEIHPLDIEAFDASIKELQDMQSRRHQDNFLPNQKTILPLNRYDDAERVVARALYAFNGQTARELSFRKGEMINVRRQIDANWYEGEIHGRIGLFPYNYVEIMKGDVAQSPKKPAVVEGRARAKFDFTAQTSLELPLKKGELVVLTRRIDHNWWEGRNGNKTGIFPDSYVTILQEPSQNKPESTKMQHNNIDKPMASPAAHGLVNGAAKRSMGAHAYTPQHNSPALANAPPATQPLPGYVAKPAQVSETPSERGYGPPAAPGLDLNNTEPLYVDTNAEAIPYRAMYKYRPQNPDELELNEGDTVYVLEQCDDGWYVGSSQRTGRFGTFPGNYVERI